MKQKKETLKYKAIKPLNEDLKIRVLNAKKMFPSSGVTSFFLQQYPKHNTVKGKSLLNNVLQCRSTDEEITVDLEAFAKLLQLNINL